MSIKIKCEICKKEIEGLTEKQATQLLRVHKTTHGGNIK